MPRGFAVPRIRHAERIEEGGRPQRVSLGELIGVGGIGVEAFRLGQVHGPALLDRSVPHPLHDESVPGRVDGGSQPVFLVDVDRQDAHVAGLGAGGVLSQFAVQLGTELVAGKRIALYGPLHALRLDLVQTGRVCSPGSTSVRSAPSGDFGIVLVPAPRVGGTIEGPRCAVRKQPRPHFSVQLGLDHRRAGRRATVDGDADVTGIFREPEPVVRTEVEVGGEGEGVFVRLAPAPLPGSRRPIQRHRQLAVAVRFLDDDSNLTFTSP